MPDGACTLYSLAKEGVHTQTAKEGVHTLTAKERVHTLTAKVGVHIHTQLKRECTHTEIKERPVRLAHHHLHNAYQIKQLWSFNILCDITNV